jgi:hypothetical protein
MLADEVLNQVHGLGRESGAVEDAFLDAHSRAEVAIAAEQQRLLGIERCLGIEDERVIRPRVGLWLWARLPAIGADRDRKELV